jgi:hypothetical protein
MGEKVKLSYPIFGEVKTKVKTKVVLAGRACRISQGF